MRRLGMKSKRRKSEMTTDSESEENGMKHPTTSDGGVSETRQSNEVEISATNTTPSLRKATAKKRTFRGRHGQKADEPVEDSQDDGDIAQTTEEQENGSLSKVSSNKRRKKEESKASTSSKPGAEQEYEVEKIVGHRTIKGRRQFLVRWKGYDENSDTWENEKDLNCPKLIEDFLAEDEEESEDNASEKPFRATKTKLSKTEKKNKKSKNAVKKEIESESQSEGDGKNEKDNSREFEVERIIEVHFKKNKTREFLIRWKGFSAADDSWEPEENLNCPDLIAKFMQKLEKAKTTDMRELRTNPTHTKRYTLTTHESGRRLSRRNMDKQRATYHECDE